MVGRKHTGKRELPKGFTFTISVIIISATLIAIATYASEYKQSQNAALSVAPSSDGVRIYEKVSAELAALLGADAESFRNSSSFNIKFSGGLPLKKEGAPIADLWGYSQSLAERYRTSPYEVLFVPKNGTGGNATVLLLPSSGTVRYRNNGTADLMVITHPDRWGPRTIKMWLSCEGNRSIIANLSADSGSGTQVANYAVYYSDPLGTSTSTLSGIYDTSGVRYSVLFADGSNFSFTANLSTAASNITTITYTKSPGAALILPFDDNVSTVASGAVHDYSGFGRNATLGGGLQQNAPV